MSVRYTDERQFTAQQLESLFLSVSWESGKYPERLKKALDNCGTVFTAWDGGELVGLANAIDDGEMTAYVHYLLVRPDHQGQGIGTALVDLMKRKYADYHNFFLVAEHKELVGYYKALGFIEQSETSVMLYKE
ncbi:MAG: GNAT family N-acetyltransferase [Lachnospiraceae bacterium]|nr:GNAT family N-acetyltransferase [Ruminococcus sp.]MCM1274002.1 GNAT family N-acetyltransferase [Lachnospiraceae bacterium]